MKHEYIIVQDHASSYRQGQLEELLDSGYRIVHCNITSNAVHYILRKPRPSMALNDLTEDL